MGEGCGAVGCIAGQSNVPWKFSVLTLSKSLFEHVQATGDHRQQVIEVVSQTTGQLADCFHFLTLL
ncbi:hypothetical protein ALO48_200003 [Pseudomonas syringae pv. rhaphiolepidis]|nr:hypothetical protein ALO48_200003 [Pseudomonas syringae pv. rhaphiolepidis]